MTNFRASVGHNPSINVKRAQPIVIAGQSVSLSIGVGAPPASGFTSQSGFVVSLVSGSLDSGGVITITRGAGGFGTKPYDPKPVLWMPLASSSTPSALGRVTSPRGINAMSFTSTGGADGLGCLTGNASNGTSTNAWLVRLDSDSWSGSTYDWNSYGLKVYQFKKHKKDFDIPGSKNVKIFRWWDRTGVGPDSGDIQGPNYYFANSNGRMGIEGLPSPYQDYTMGGSQLTAAKGPIGSWFTEEQMYKTNTAHNLTTPDGDYRISCSGGPELVSFPNTTWATWYLGLKADSGFSGSGRLRINHAVHMVIEGSDGWIPAPAGSRYYADDIYVDDSWCRVVIGDSATYNSHTNREIQIPSVWVDNSITVTLNKGAFPTLGAKHLFVVDNNNTKLYVGSFN